MVLIKVIVLVIELICIVILTWLAVQIGKANKLGRTSKDYAIWGWVARDKNGQLWFYRDKPRRSSDGYWWSANCIKLDSNIYPFLHWSDEPIEVRVPAIKK